MSTQNHLDILSSRDINQECVINVTRENIDCIDQKAKEECKILKFSSDWSFEDVVSKIPTLDVKAYPLLFIFVIDIKENSFPSSVKFLENSLTNFIKRGLIILQLTSKIKESTKIFFKKLKGLCELSKESNVADFDNFPSFIWIYLNGKIENVEDVMLEKLPKITDTSLILKFLRTLKLSGEFFENLILEFAKYGSESDILAATDGYYDNKGNIHGSILKDYLPNIIYIAHWNSNSPIISFLLGKCWNLIQDISFNEKVTISAALFKANKNESLSDLIRSLDFPFPNELSQQSKIDEKIQKVINERIEFHADVLTEDRQKIEDFIKKNPKLKFAFNVENKSAIGVALESKKFKSFALLRSNKFRNDEIEDINIENLTNEEDRTEARHYASVQTRMNVDISTFDGDLSILVLATKSLIYNRDEINPLEQEQRELIKKWYRAIYKTKYGSKFIDAVVQCKDLKIIFDFECKSVSLKNQIYFIIKKFNFIFTPILF